MIMLKRCALLAAWVLLSPAPARADTTPPEPRELTEAEREAAKKLMAIGRREEGLGNMESAASAYEKAYEITTIPTVGVRYATALSGKGNLRRALEIARLVANSVPKPSDPPVFSSARKEAQELVMGLERRIPKLRIVANAKVTDIQVDGAVPDGGARRTVAVDPGDHRVTGKYGSITLETTVKALEGREVDAELVLPKQEQQKHEEAGNGIDTRNVLIISGIALGGTGLLVGATSGLIAVVHNNKGKPFCNESLVCAEDARPYLERAQTWGLVSNIGFITAIVGGGVFAAGMLWPKKQITPQVGLGWVGLRGVFE